MLPPLEGKAELDAEKPETHVPDFPKGKPFGVHCLKLKCPPTNGPEASKVIQVCAGLQSGAGAVETRKEVHEVGSADQAITSGIKRT